MKKILTFGVLIALLHDLGLKVVLVAEDVAVPLGHRLLLTDPDRISNLYKAPSCCCNQLKHCSVMRQFEWVVKYEVL